MRERPLGFYFPLRALSRMDAKLLRRIHHVGRPYVSSLLLAASGLGHHHRPAPTCHLILAPPPPRREAEYPRRSGRQPPARLRRTLLLRAGPLRCRSYSSVRRHWPGRFFRSWPRYASRFSISPRSIHWTPASLGRRNSFRSLRPKKSFWPRPAPPPPPLPLRTYRKASLARAAVRITLTCNTKRRLRICSRPQIAASFMSACRIASCSSKPPLDANRANLA